MANHSNSIVDFCSGGSNKDAINYRLNKFVGMLLEGNTYLITHDPQPASRADMASEGLPRLHA
ncbi:hypothetical protein, partial [Aeromonas media]|uniref:hypothetical protein n=1 Tax=Aeromonas media TaxID=651 RepID=UPI003D1E18A2